MQPSLYHTTHPILSYPILPLILPYPTLSYHTIHSILFCPILSYHSSYPILPLILSYPNFICYHFNPIIDFVLFSAAGPRRLRGVIDLDGPEDRNQRQGPGAEIGYVERIGAYMGLNVVGARERERRRQRDRQRQRVRERQRQRIAERLGIQGPAVQAGVPIYEGDVDNEVELGGLPGGRREVGAVDNNLNDVHGINNGPNLHPNAQNEPPGEHDQFLIPQRRWPF